MGALRYALTFTPAGDRIVFVMRKAYGPLFGRLDLFSVERDGSGLVRLDIDVKPTDNPWLEEYDVTTTPDGARVLYRADHDRDGRHELYSVPTTGGTPVLLAKSSVGGVDPDTHQAPHVVRFVVAGDRAVVTVGTTTHDLRGTDELISVPVSGGPSTRLHDPAVGGDRDIQQVAATSDGRRVVYLVDTTLQDRYELFSAPVDGSSGPVRLNTPLEGPSGTVESYSLASGRVVFSGLLGSGEGAVFSVDPAAGQPVQLGEDLGDARHHALSPAGDRAVLVAGDQLWSVAVTGGTPVSLGMAPPPSVRSLRPSAIRFTPDGRDVVYERPQAPGDRPSFVSDLYAVPAAGGTTVKLTGELISPQTELGAEWVVSRDGRHVVYATQTRSPDGQYTERLWRATVTDGTLVQLTQRPRLPNPRSGLDQVQHLDWLRVVGDRILFRIGAGRSLLSLYSIPIAGGPPILIEDIPHGVWVQAASGDGRSVAINTPGPEGEGPTPHLWATETNHGVGRLAGRDRFATAAATALAVTDDADTVYLATGRAFADALSVGPLATSARAPIVLTEPGTLPAATRNRLVQLTPSRVVLVGGAKAITESVAEEVRAATGAIVERIAGTDRYETSAAIAGAFDPVDTVYVATGAAFPDALSGGALAARQRVPILLTTSETLPAATRAALQRLRPRTVVVIGGHKAVSEAVRGEIASATGASTVRVAGSDRYATSAAVAARFRAAEEAFVATGRDFADALVAVPAAGRSGAPVVLVAPDTVPTPIRTQLARLLPRRIVVVGGAGAVREPVVEALFRHVR